MSRRRMAASVHGCGCSDAASVIAAASRAPGAPATGCRRVFSSLLAGNAAVLAQPLRRQGRPGVERGRRRPALLLLVPLGLRLLLLLAAAHLTLGHDVPPVLILGSFPHFPPPAAEAREGAVPRMVAHRRAKATGPTRPRPTSSSAAALAAASAAACRPCLRASSRRDR